MEKGEIMSYHIAHILPYIAGLMDGEGCFTISKRGQPTITTSMYNRDALDIISDIFGGNVRQINRKDDKPIYQIHITDRNAINMAITLEEYLVVKKPEALLIEYGDDMILNKGGHRPLSCEEKNKRLNYYNRMQQLLNRYRKV